MWRGGYAKEVVMTLTDDVEQHESEKKHDNNYAKTVNKQTAAFLRAR